MILCWFKMLLFKTEFCVLLIELLIELVETD